MGFLIYDKAEYELDDRPLAHLRVAVNAKLRLQECFVLNWSSSDGGRVDLWMSPAIPLSFRFSGSRAAAIKAEWLQALVRSGSSTGGMMLMNENDAERYLSETDA